MIVEIKEPRTGLNADIKIPGLTDRPPGLKQVAVFSKQLATLINAWVPLVQSLAILQRQLDNKTFENVIKKVRGEVESGVPLSEALQEHPKVARVIHPWLEDHPQHELARRQMTGGGTVVTFDVRGGKEQAFAVMNALRLVDISNNLGDSKSLITHPATTTHRRMGEEARAAIGITDATLRISVGLEAADDLVADLRRALG